MSLKAFHIVFVTVSILLAFGCGIWSVLNFRVSGSGVDLVLGAGWILAGFALLVYGRAILRKLKHISYL